MYAIRTCRLILYIGIFYFIFHQSRYSSIFFFFYSSLNKYHHICALIGKNGQNFSRFFFFFSMLKSVGASYTVWCRYYTKKKKKLTGPWIRSNNQTVRSSRGLYRWGVYTLMFKSFACFGCIKFTPGTINQARAFTFKLFFFFFPLSLCCPENFGFLWGYRKNTIAKTRLVSYHFVSMLICCFFALLVYICI